MCDVMQIASDDKKDNDERSVHNSYVNGSGGDEGSAFGTLETFISNNKSLLKNEVEHGESENASSLKILSEEVDASGSGFEILTSILLSAGDSQPDFEINQVELLFETQNASLNLMNNDVQYNKSTDHLARDSTNENDLFSSYTSLTCDTISGSNSTETVCEGQDENYCANTGRAECVEIKHIHCISSSVNERIECGHVGVDGHRPSIDCKNALNSLTSEDAEITSSTIIPGGTYEKKDADRIPDYDLYSDPIVLFFLRLIAFGQVISPFFTGDDEEEENTIWNDYGRIGSWIDMENIFHDLTKVVYCEPCDHEIEFIFTSPDVKATEHDGVSHVTMQCLDETEEVSLKDNTPVKIRDASDKLEGDFMTMINVSPVSPIELEYNTSVGERPSYSQTKDFEDELRLSIRTLSLPPCISLGDHDFQENQIKVISSRPAIQSRPDINNSLKSSDMCQLTNSGHKDPVLHYSLHQDAVPIAISTENKGSTISDSSQRQLQSSVMVSSVSVTNMDQCPDDEYDEPGCIEFSKTRCLSDSHISRLNEECLERSSFQSSHLNDMNSMLESSIRRASESPKALLSTSASTPVRLYVRYKRLRKSRLFKEKSYM